MDVGGIYRTRPAQDGYSHRIISTLFRELAAVDAQASCDDNSLSRLDLTKATPRLLGDRERKIVTEERGIGPGAKDRGGHSVHEQEVKAQLRICILERESEDPSTRKHWREAGQTAPEHLFSRRFRY